MPMSELKHSVIERIARFERDHCALLIACIAGLGTAHILVRTATDGAVIEGDSVCFLSTASNFLAGEGWRYFTGSSDGGMACGVRRRRGRFVGGLWGHGLVCSKSYSIRLGRVVFVRFVRFVAYKPMYRGTLR